MGVHMDDIVLPLRAAANPEWVELDQQEGQLGPSQFLTQRTPANCSTLSRSDFRRP